jgi:hypothetical protein
MAIWHQPLFTAGTTFGDGNGLSTRDLWRTLYARGADLILNGHDHNYQRYAPQTPDGVADPKHGIGGQRVEHGGFSNAWAPEFSFGMVFAIRMDYTVSGA